MQVNWRGSQLMVTGKLSIIEATINQREAVIGPRILAVDEAGVQWELRHPSFPSEMLPYALPEVFPARYCVQELQKGSRYPRVSYHVDANSVTDAVRIIKETPSLYASEDSEWICDISRRGAVRPQTGAEPGRTYL